jgi:Nucleotidyltransferase of unknown function (DUF6036)
VNGPLLDKGKMLAAFALLDERLGRRNVIAQIHVIGGAAMSLAWEDRRTTRDVDALFETDRHGVLIEEIHGVADELNLPNSWLNEQATYYAPADYRSNEGIVFGGHHLQVAAASAEVVLAMKVRAARPGDIQDIRILLGLLGLDELDAVLEVHDRYFPDSPLPTPKQMVIEDLLAPTDSE